MYDLIKKELVTLRVDSHALAASVRALAKAQEEMHRHWEALEDQAEDVDNLWAAVSVLEARLTEMEATVLSQERHASELTSLHLVGAHRLLLARPVSAYGPPFA